MQSGSPEFYYLPLWVDSNFCFLLASVVWAVEPDWVLSRSKRKLYSLIKEWRNSGPHSKMHSPQKAFGEGPCQRVKGVELQWYSCTTHSAPDQNAGWSILAQGALLASWRVLCNDSAQGLPSWSIRWNHFTLGTLVRSARCKAPSQWTLWARETRISPRGGEKKLDCILLFYLMYLMYPGFFASHPVLRQARFHDFHYPNSPQNSTELEDQIQKSSVFSLFT